MRSPTRGRSTPATYTLAQRLTGLSPDLLDLVLGDQISDDSDLGCGIPIRGRAILRALPRHSMPILSSPTPRRTSPSSRRRASAPMRPRALDSDSSLAVLFQGRRRFVAAAEVSAGDRARYEELRDNRILDLDRGIYRASHIALCSRYQLPAPPIRTLTGDWKAQHSAAKQPGRITATAQDFQ